MMFSGTVQSYRCSKCETNYSNVIPTSIVPLLVVLLIAFALWTELLVCLVGGGLLSYLIALVSSLGSFPLYFVLLQRMLVPWTQSLTCPKCQTKLEVVGGGFVDGGMPSLNEILLYLLIVGTPLVLLALK